MHAITATSVQAAAHASTAPLTAGLRVPSLGPCPLARPRSIPAQKAAPSDMRPATTLDAMCGLREMLCAPSDSHRLYVPEVTLRLRKHADLLNRCSELAPCGRLCRKPTGQGPAAGRHHLRGQRVTGLSPGRARAAG